MDILVKDGKITRIAPDITDDSEEIIEAKGLVVAPGLIDTHIHFRDPGFTYKEDIHTGAKSICKRRIYNCHLYGKYFTNRRQCRHLKR